MKSLVLAIAIVVWISFIYDANACECKCAGPPPNNASLGDQNLPNAPWPQTMHDCNRHCDEVAIQHWLPPASVTRLGSCMREPIVTPPATYTPQICAKFGEPANGPETFRFKSQPYFRDGTGWLYLTIPAGQTISKIYCMVAEEREVWPCGANLNDDACTRPYKRLCDTRDSGDACEIGWSRVHYQEWRRNPDGSHTFSVVMRNESGEHKRFFWIGAN